MKQQKVKQPFSYHLEELRSRMFFVVLSIIITSFAGYYLHDKIVFLMTNPLDSPLFFTNPGGGFEFVIKVSVVFGLILSIPIISFNLVRFFEPMMMNTTRKTIWALVIASITLAILGVIFAYVVSLPAAINFLMSVSSENVNPLISTSEYMNFVLIYLAGFAILFQIPLLLFIINKITPLKPLKLLKNQKMIILVSFIVAAILTPTPDPLNQTIMAAPAILMYQFGIMLVALDNMSTARSQAKCKEFSVSRRYESSLFLDDEADSGDLTEAILAPIKPAKPKVDAKASAKPSAQSIDGFSRSHTSLKPTKSKPAFNRTLSGKPHSNTAQHMGVVQLG